MLIRPRGGIFCCIVVLLWGIAIQAQTAKPLKVMVITDMEGVDGVFDEELQCIPLKSPRWEESRKLLTGETNAAVDGLLAGGATEVVVWDGHWDGDNLSVLDIHPKARLWTGPHKSFDLDSSYAAEIFIGQHAMAGTEKAILSHTKSPEGIQNIWVNGKAVGEIGLEVMHAGYYGIPVIMLSGDTAACREIEEFVPRVECAEVKSGTNRTAGLMLSHPAACALIREKARRTMERLSEFKPCKVTNPVEVKIEYTTTGSPDFQAGDGVARVGPRVWIVRGKDYMDAYHRAKF